MTDIITILVTVAITFVIKQQLIQKDGSFSKLSSKQLWLLTGAPILVACYVVAVAIKDYNIADDTLHLLTGYRGMLSGTDPNWDAGVIKGVVESMSSEEMAFYVMTEFYEGLTRVVAFVACICAAFSTIKLHDRTKFPKFTHQRLMLISIIVIIATLLFNFYRVATNTSLIVGGMGEYTEDVEYGVLFGSGLAYIVIIALIILLYVAYKKVVVAYLAIPSQPVAPKAVEVQQLTTAGEETKRCPYCGEEILAIAKKCKHCGEWIKPEDEVVKTEELQEEAKPVVIQCPICGEDVEKGTAVCPHCNEPIEEA